MKIEAYVCPGIFKSKNDRILAQKITYKNGKSVVHSSGCGQSDYALCGHDLAGDDFAGEAWEEGIFTNEKIDCHQCIAIIKFCKSIRHSKIKKKNDP